MVWELTRQKLLRRPIVCMGFWQPVVDLVAGLAPGLARAVQVVDSPAQLRDIFPLAPQS